MSNSDKLDFEVHPIRRNEWDMGMQLAWDTFMVFEAPMYEAIGVQNFHSFVKGKELKQLFLLGEYDAYGAYVNRIMVGIIGIRKKSHVSLLFVDSDYHRNGIATALLKNVFSISRNRGINEMTVNSSPYAVEFYHKLGFVDTEAELTTDGIRYTPMKISLA